MKYLKCNLCGQIIEVVTDTNMPIICCNEQMHEIKANEKEEELKEKHIPVYKIEKGKVITRIGSVPHPMSKDHYIEWVALVTNKGKQQKCLKPGDFPRVEFSLGKDERVEEIYAYCNIHSLWKIKVNK